MKIISSITTYFSHSNQGTHHLKEEMKQEKDKRGIEVAGVTRFSTFSIHASSISHCFEGIRRCYTKGTVKFDTAAVSHSCHAWFIDSLLWVSTIRQNLFTNILRTAQLRISFYLICTTSTWCFRLSHVGWRHWKVKTAHAQMSLTSILVLLSDTTMSFVMLVSRPMWFMAWKNYGVTLIFIV